MPNIEAQPEWADVREIGIELARGGPDGNMNEQAKALVARTELLKEEKASKAEIVQGVFEFDTYALFDAVKSTLPLNCTVVISEENTTGIGRWSSGNNQWNGSVLSKSSYDPVQKSLNNTKVEIEKNNNKINFDFLQKYVSESEELLLAITDSEGNLTWVQIDKNTGLPSEQTNEIIRNINKIDIINGDIRTTSDEKVAIALRDSSGNLTALTTVREEDGMFIDAVIENIKQRLNIIIPNVDISSDFRTYDTTLNIHMLKSVSSAVVRHINNASLPATPYDFVDSLGQGARIYLPKNYNDGTPIPLVIVFDGVGSNGGVTPPTVRSQFTGVLLENGVAICKSQAHGDSYGNPACMQSYLEVFRKACEIAPIGAVILMGNSMGGIAAQNALLTNTIPNISGLYLTDPTYDLRQRYDNGRKNEITAAYSIAPNGSDYAEKTAGYDPALRHWSHYRSIPIHIRASSGDTSVVLSLHGQKLKTYLAQHNDVTLIDTGTSGHNISDRFDGEELLTFIKKCTKLI